MKLQAANPSALSTRCQFYTPSGRQCRLFASDQNSLLCSHHLAIEKQKDTSNVYAPLIRNSQGLQTAQGINYSLSNLYELLAKNHISPRRAAVLAYINSLLLRTLPQIDTDNTAGIVYPPKPAPIDVPVADENADTGQASALGSASDSSTTTELEMNGQMEARTETLAGAQPEAKTDANKDTLPVSANTWDPSIPEPDPRKKPS